MTSEDRINRLIQAYLAGNLAEEEKGVLADWLEQSSGNREYFASIAAVSRISSAVKCKSRSPVEAELARLNARIDAGDTADKAERTPGSVRRYLHKGIRIGITAAAAVAAVAVLVYVSVSDAGRFRASDESRYLTCSNGTDDISAILLEDSTRIWLGTGSSISYDVSGNAGNRVVRLCGNAYFDVHRDTLLPFTVVTDALSVRVLGTAFCVDSGNETGKVSVLLERGSVRLQTPGGVDLIRLRPDQRAEMDIRTGDMSVEMVPAVPYIVQNYNKITLQAATVGDIMAHIGKMYGVNVSAPADADTTRKFTLNYRRTDSVGQVLEIVRELTGVRLSVSEAD